MDTENPIDFMRKNRAYFEDYVTRSTYNSNAIEGSTLSLEEVRSVLWETPVSAGTVGACDPEVTIGATFSCDPEAGTDAASPQTPEAGIDAVNPHIPEAGVDAVSPHTLETEAPLRERFEALNHKQAWIQTMESIDEDLSEALIKRLAITINQHVNEISGYRHYNVVIFGSNHTPPAPTQVNQLMMQLVYEYNRAPFDDPFYQEAHFHIRFERIHPFSDGNGRTGRILLNRGLLKARCAPAVIPATEQETYRDYVNRVDYDALAEMLRRLSKTEEERMKLLASDG